jgi:hypothetical protein
LAWQMFWPKLGDFSNLLVTLMTTFLHCLEHLKYLGPMK